jgi:hypothetical protein
MDLEKVLFFVLLIEAMIQNLKLVYDSAKHKLNPDVAISLVISVGACFFFGIDLFGLSAFESIWPPLGSIFTGVVVSRGAGFVHDLFETQFFKSWQALHEKEVARKTSASMQ